jgi:AcrR family transcriptional regulator
MTSGAVVPRRSRNAQATREALLAAAQDLFGRKGYERTTTREIGEAAGVDPALIARYFGSKADLYLAAVAAERLADDGQDGRDSVDDPFVDLEQVVDVVLRRTARQGLGPILQALVRDDASPEIREAARSRLVRRMVEPVAAQLEADGDDRPTLRAQVAVAALLGVGLGRSLGWFDELSATDPDELTGLVLDALGRPDRPSPVNSRANGRGTG